MILPRPMPDKVTPDMVAELIEQIHRKFQPGNPFKIINQARTVPYYVFQRIENDMVHATIGKNHHRWAKFGIFRFYCHVDEVWEPLWGFQPGEQWPPMAWLVSGVDGVLNVDRLAEAVAKNGQIMPILGKPDGYGEALASILKEMTEKVRTALPSERLAVTERIDYALMKYGTTLEALAKESGLLIKQVENDQAQGKS